MKVLLCNYDFHLGDFILPSCQNMAWLTAACCASEELQLSVLRQYKLIQNVGIRLLTCLGTPGVLSFGFHLIKLMIPLAESLPPGSSS